MKNAWSKALLVVTIGLLVPGVVQAPATYLNKNLQSKTHSDSQFTLHHREPTKGKDVKRVKPTTSSSTMYPFSSPNDELARNFVREIASFKLKQPRDRLIESGGDERSVEFGATNSEEYPMHSDEIPDDYPTFPSPGYAPSTGSGGGGSSGSSGVREGTKIQHSSGPSYYSSGLEDEPEDDGGYNNELLNYEVTETIPGDTKYQRPKLPVVPVAPPCPSLPGPPRPPILDQGRGSPKKKKPTRYYMKSRGKGRLVYQPYIVRKIQYPTGNGNVIFRHKTIPIPAPPLRTQPPPQSHGGYHRLSSPASKLAGYGKTAKIIKEVHIHHHHPPFIPPGTVFPVAVSYKNGVTPSDGYQSLATSTKSLRFPPSFQQQGIRTATSGTALSGHFAEPPPFTTIGYI